jgi:hypothetical protein
MDPVTLIVTALAAGAASALQDDARGVVKGALARLRRLAVKRFKDPANGQYILDKHASAPEIWRPALQQELTESGAAGDSELIDAAQELMKLLDAQGSQAGKYVVTVQNSQGVQFGDHNSQVNNFGSVTNNNIGSVTAGRDAYVAGRDINRR